MSTGEFIILNLSLLKDLYKLTQPVDSWKPVFDDENDAKTEADDDVQDPNGKYVSAKFFRTVFYRQRFILDQIVKNSLDKKFLDKYHQDKNYLDLKIRECAKCA